jgi:hypothetical protein
VGLDVDNGKTATKEFRDDRNMVPPEGGSKYALYIDVPEQIPNVNVSIIGTVGYDHGFGRDELRIFVSRTPTGEWIQIGSLGPSQVIEFDPGEDSKRDNSPN